MSEEAIRSKDRSPNFPFISLEAALARAEQLYAKEKRGIAPFSVVAAHWNYSPNSSSALQTVGALKSYGLLSDEGGARSQRSLRLTELALRILLDRRPDSAERAEYLRLAATSPAIATEVYSRWPDLPSEATLNHALVFDWGFSGQKVASVSRILLENHVFAGMSSSGIEPSSTENQTDWGAPVSRDLVPIGQPTARQRLSEMPLIASGAPTPRNEPAPARGAPERLTFRGAEILIYFDGEPDFATLDFIEQYIKLRKQLLKAHDGKEPAP